MASDKSVKIINCVVSAGADGLVKTWSLRNGDQLKTYRAHGGRVNSLAMLTDPAAPFEYRCISGGVDRSVHVWDLTTATPSFLLKGHKDEVISVAVVKTPNNAHYGCISKQTKKIVSYGKQTKFLTIAPIGSHDAENMVIVSGSRDTNVWLWDYRSRKALFVFRGHGSPVTGVTGFVCRSRQLVLASAGDDGTLKLWSVCGGVCVRSSQEHSRSIRGLSTLHMKINGEESYTPMYNR
jgi:WD40 repeat protein